MCLRHVERHDAEVGSRQDAIRRARRSCQDVQAEENVDYFDAPARTTLIHSTSSLNGPAFLSPRRKPTAFTSAGSTGRASLTTRPNDVASNFFSGNLTSIHPSFFVFTAARYEKATSGLGMYKFIEYSRPSPGP